ncbi:hypothetical protein BKA64DRAFT_38638 [Cadophora sp. MPI-SDFR-AT-0126]|nr:hypothetical protein BKA64DRAFT_38638 [Leotiomycetes sp. MPI-SDFR-AT-0126]
MAATTSVPPAGLGSSTSRSPLRPKSITPTPTNTIRRKGSFIRLPDSSEDLPSPHESIFEAIYFSASEASSHKVEIVDIPSRIPRPVKRNDENSRNVSPSNFIDTVQFRYGNGTVLNTITEQKSYTTISSKARTKSADNSPSIPFLCHRDSFILSKTPRRQISFSLDDIEEIKRSYHDACMVIEQELCKPLLAQEIYAEPKAPVQAPPDRSPTPPGMPSWTESQFLTIPRRRQSQQPQMPRQSRVRRFFNLSSATVTPSDQVPQERNRTVSAPIPGRTAPRFRPPKSVYGAIDQHPFVKAPIAKIQSDSPSAIPKPRGKRLQKEQRVRFTPSATARDSEANILQAATESTTAAAPHPFQPFPSTLRPAPKEGCPHRKSSGSTAAQEMPKTTIVDERPTIRSPVPYHREDDLSSLSPLQGIASPNSPSTPTQAELDSLCVLEPLRDRPASVTSTTYLMSGALRAPIRSTPVLESELPELTKEKWCWKCTLQSAVGKLDDWWMKSAGCVCFVCCGFDIDEDGNVSNGTSHQYNGAMRRGYGSEMSGPRMVVLNQTPAVIL